MADYIYEKVRQLIDDEKFDEAIKTAQQISHYDKPEGLYWAARAKFDKACLIFKDSDTFTNEAAEDEANALIGDALKDIDNCMDLYDTSDEDERMLFQSAYVLKGWILTRRSNSEARRIFINALSSDYPSIVEIARDGYEYSTKKILNIVNTYTSLESDIKEVLGCNDMTEEEKNEIIDFYKQDAENSRFVHLEHFSDRQFIFVVKDIDHIAGCVDDNIKCVFTLNDIPTELTFPIGHPQANTFYMAHPAKEGFYLPYENAERTMFHEKVNEFIRLSQCLGATKISFRWKHGEQIEGSNHCSTDAQVSGGKKKIMNIGAQYSGEYTENYSAQSHSGIAKELTFDPMRKPYIPEDVIWLNLDSSWQTFVKQRLEGNTLHYTIQISSSESSSFSNSRRQSIKASFESLLSTVDGKYESHKSSSFMEDYDTLWELDVDFRSLRDFNSDGANLQMQQLSIEEKAFVEEVHFCLEENNNLSDTDRKYLDRKRIKLGITEQRAKEIINLCKPNLSQEEKEYLATFHELVEDAASISPKLRKMLDREAESLGITQDRKLELEKMK